MTTPSRKDLRLLEASGRICLQVHRQFETQGLAPEDCWLVLALAARAMERGVIETCRSVGDMKPYAEALTRLTALFELSDLTSDAVDKTLRERAGMPPTTSQ